MIAKETWLQERYPEIPACAKTDSPTVEGAPRGQRLRSDGPSGVPANRFGSNPAGGVVKLASRMQTAVRSLPAASCRDTRVALAAWPWQTYADGAALRCSALSSGATMSIGRGKTMVEFLSAAITVKVSR